MKRPYFRPLATGATALTFAVVATTGVMLFFRLFDAKVKELHEILGLVFAAAAPAHLSLHWKSMRTYFPKRSFLALGSHP